MKMEATRKCTALSGVDEKNPNVVASENLTVCEQGREGFIPSSRRPNSEKRQNLKTILQRRSCSRKFTLLFTLIFINSLCAFAQDIINLKSGEVIEAKVVEVSPVEIKYKNFNHQDGPMIVILADDVLYIRYENDINNDIIAIPIVPDEISRDVPEPKEDFSKYLNVYLEGIIPPFLKQIFNDAPSLFAGGATYTDFGLGLSLFKNIIKIQVQYGFLTQDLYEAIGGEGMVRYGGKVFGIKLLAGYQLPFRVLFGSDWEWLSASFALGANFSLFNISGEENPKYSTKEKPMYFTPNGDPAWLSALLLQIEFPKVTIQKRYLRTFSLFTECQLWFVPTDVDDAAANDIPVVIPHIIMGLRLYIF